MAIKVPKISGQIDAGKLHKLLKSKLSGFLHKPVIYLVDRVYQLTSRYEIERFLKEDKTSLVKYTKEWHDCDDFSFRLMGQFSIPEWSGIAFGIAFSKVHAFNIFTDGKEVWIIEPQSDDTWKVSEIPKKYKKYFLPITFVLM